MDDTSVGGWVTGLHCRKRIGYGRALWKNESLCIDMAVLAPQSANNGSINRRWHWRFGPWDMNGGISPSRRHQDRKILGKDFRGKSKQPVLDLIVRHKPFAWSLESPSTEAQED